LISQSIFALHIKENFAKQAVFCHTRTIFTGLRHKYQIY